jgi:hypothetical protein
MIRPQVFYTGQLKGDTAAIFLDGVKIVHIQYINFRGLFCYVMNADGI